MADMFVGRKKEREEILEFVSKRPAGVIVLKGSSDTGKSALLRKLAEEFRVAGHASGQYRIESLDDSTRPLIKTLSDVVGQLSLKETDGSTTNALLNILTKKASRTKFSIALVKDLTESLKLKHSYENLANELSESLKSATVETRLDEMLTANKASVHAVFIELLRDISTNLNTRKCILLIDQTEDAGEPFWDFLVDVCKALPDGFFIAFSVNPDMDSYDRMNKRYIGHLKKLYPLFKVKNIDGLLEEDVEELVAGKGRMFNKADIMNIMEQSGGIPYLIIVWLTSEEFSKGEINFPETERYDGFFKQRLKILTKEARRLINYLAVLPQPMDGGLTAYCEVLGIKSVADCAESMRELVDTDMFRDFDDYKWFTNVHFKKFVFKQLDPAEIKESVEITLAYMKKHGLMESEKGFGKVVAAELVQHTDDYAQAFKLNSDLVISAFYKNNFTLSLKAASACSKIAEKTNNRSQKAFALNQMGLVWYVYGELDMALQFYKESLGLRREIGDQVGEGRTLNNISLIYHDRNDDDTALEYLEKSLEIGQTIGDQVSEGRTLNNIGEIYRARNDDATALEYLEKSLEKRRTMKDRHGEAKTLNRIGEIRHDSDDDATALEYFEESLKICCEINYPFGEGMTLYNIATIFAKQGRIPEAIEFMEKVVKIDKNLGLPRLEDDQAFLERLQINSPASPPPA